jgi:tRNA modification GTPase
MPSGDLARDTIAAIATPSGRGGIGIVRVSGPKVVEIAVRVLGSLPGPRHAAYATFRDAGGQPIDRGIALFFPAPASYTGEAVLELQGHGGPVVMHAVLAACLDAGARIAEPGEFTRRAFLEGKLDLAQAEAVADLIEATSAEAARSAMRSLDGEFSSAIDSVQTLLIELRALTEAMLDFPDEEVDTLHRDDAMARLATVRTALDDVVIKSRQGSLLRSGLTVVLAGRPNVGKSSLLNCLAGEERAIVSAIPGTTRDALHAMIQIEGVPISLVDTAGLRESPDEIERLGIERTQRELQRADLVLAVREAGADDKTADDFVFSSTTVRIDVYNKVDLISGFVAAKGVAVSAKTGEGLDRLRAEILRAAGWQSTGESLFLARERHLRALEAAARHLAIAAETLQWELFAEELRLAHRELGTIKGEFTPENLLGEIFGRFCVGK